MSIRRLLALTAATGVAFAAVRVVPFVGFFLVACLPFTFAFSFAKKPRRFGAWVLLLFSLVPIYFASIGPAGALAFLVYNNFPSKPEWPYRLFENCYPLPKSLGDDSTIAGKAIIEYCDQWGEIAGSTRYSSVFDGQELGPWLFWVEQTSDK